MYYARPTKPEEMNEQHEQEDNFTLPDPPAEIHIDLD